MTESDSSHRIFLSLGTNLGERRMNLQQAISAMADSVDVTDVSRLYQTAPWGLEDQPDFLNICLAGFSELSPPDLLIALKDVEGALGRKPGVRWGPRLIDIDIIFYDEIVYQADDLMIPHKHVAERAFVLVPLADIAPAYRHPIIGMTVTDMLAQVDESTVYRVAGQLHVG